MPCEVVMTSSVLDSLPPRPPTPPRETHHEPSIAPRHVVDALDPRPNVHTPPGIHSPGDSITTNSTTRRSRKKVEFSAKAEYKDPPAHLEGDAKAQHPTPVSLPRSASKPVKSILKVTHHAPNPLSANGDATDSFASDVNLAAMLESTIQQLAGGDRETKMDAYMMLTRACKASNNLPDRVALQEKMGLFTQFMQRDIVWKSQEGSADVSLENRALTLLIAFLGFPAIASMINTDFGVFIIDHSIRSFENPSVPKEALRHLMRVVALQNFSPKVMTSDRVGRLIASLHGIQEHVTGKTIVMSRIQIYRKLLSQSKGLMIVHSEWLSDLFMDMLSNVRDIRSAAIALGLEAAFSVGHEKQLSRKVMEVFNHEIDEKLYIEHYREKLHAMSSDKNESSTVPEIWSVVILLLRISLSKWEGCMPWLHIVQACFNSHDFATKINANRAWSRLVYLMHTEGTLAKHIPTFTTPFISQLKRKGKMTDDLRRAIFGGICNLFYYAFQPNANPAALDKCWDSSVKPVITALLDTKSEAAADNMRRASLMLTTFFDCKTLRRWKADRIVDNSPVKSEELPPLDSKWVRSNAAKVLGTVGPILEQDFLHLAYNDSPTYKLWEALVFTVASAGSKEIKVSKETTGFLTEAFNLLQKIWKTGLPLSDGPQPDARQFLLAAKAFLEIMVKSLGTLPFTDKPGKNQGLVKAPLYMLFAQLSTLPPGIPDDEAFADFFGSVFASFFTSKGEKARMDLAQELLAVVPMETPRPYGPWLLVAGRISAWLGSNQASHQSTASGSDAPVGHHYRDIVKVLERGIRSTPQLPWQHWEVLFYALFERARDEAGDAGFAIVCVEPLAKVLLEHVTTETHGSVGMRCATELLSVATQPRDRQAVDAAKRRLWGTVLAGPRSSSFDTFDYLYKVANEVLKRLYDHYDAENTDSAVNILKEVGGFLDRCNRQLFLRSLLALQDGFLPWIHDEKRKLGGLNSPVFASSRSLWDRLATLIREMEQPEQQLESLERVFCAALNSSHRHIVNSSVSLWNNLFQNTANLEYPEELKAVLLRLQPHVDIVLPGLEVPSGPQAGQQPPFADLMDDEDLPSLRPVPSSRGKTPESGSLSVPSRRLRHITPTKAISKASRRNTTPRLRHDDSQVQFAAIDPSPLANRQEESQVLTERQKEVRERQKENAALFSDIRSSPGPKSKNQAPRAPIREPSPRPSPPVRQVATPEPDNFDSFVSSTPTPRRGQAVAVLADHDMPDLPSSPPEPRRNPLAAEILSRSASNSLLEEWGFSSSPVSGSPNPVRHAPNPEPIVLGDGQVVEEEEEESLAPHPEQMVIDDGQAVEEEESLDDSKNMLPVNKVAEVDVAEAEPEPETESEDEVVEDTILPATPSKAGNAMELPKLPMPPNPTTPRRRTRSSRGQETPKSDGEVFVDAPTSPLPPSPKPTAERATRVTRASRLRHQENASSRSPSLSAGDAAEKRSSQVVVQLDAGKIISSDYRVPSMSVSPLKQSLDVPVADCIVVGDSPQQSVAETPLKDPKPELAVETAAVSTPKSRQKRKRGSSKVFDSGSRKRRHYTPARDVDELSEVPDSQPSSAVKYITAPAHNYGMRFSSCELEGEGGGSLAQTSRSISSPELGALDPVEVQSSLVHDREAEFQIVRESRSQTLQREKQKRAAPAEPEETTDAMEVDNELSTIQEQPESEAQHEPPQQETSQSYMRKFISMLRSGAELLLSAPQVTREEVYEAEDALMEVRRALHEAERRGRA
ncbi:Rap1-interacting factor 1 N terminal-domain-containing protein [Schizothecium vesticola]|uniref:Rap1-interacting factor 1 N terminal-domain-containing protein n=1 Tax=Schizothecium vesticola TaxID=314040 RepID=A0AA40EVZ3_9PEZI|nr:Rap1-interacting factor 1 N terminal-domain-containing protein [Schizothecium vesticola]